MSVPQPLAGLKAIEFTHMVMGPTAGAVLAALGAEVVRVEPIGGDATRRLVGSGAGYFPMYNRHKASICLNLKSSAGLEIAKKLVQQADILIENYRPEAMDNLGLGYEDLKVENARLIYCSEKGFLPGPYEHRTALDEVAQMMGGLAYMTGPPGKPLRAGASVIDVAGGMFGVIAILAAVEERHRTGLGQKVASSLFETTVYLVGQHMAQMAVTGKAADPMPARLSAWAIYDVFETEDQNSVFIGVVSDSQWRVFCELFDLNEFWNNPQLRLNNDRVMARDLIMPTVRAVMRTMTKDALIMKLEKSGLPFAPVARPQDMFDDPHLLASDGMEQVTLPDGRITQLPGLPIQMSGARLSSPSTLPNPGAQTHALLEGLGLNPAEIATLLSSGAVQADIP